MVTDGSCNVEDIIEKEKEILDILEYNIKVTLPQSFLNIEYRRNNFDNFSIEERQRDI